MKTNLSGVIAPSRLSPLVADGLFIRQDGYYKKYFYADILCIEASGNYCYFYFEDKSRVTVACRLGAVERQLPDASCSCASGFYIEPALCRHVGGQFLACPG